MILVWQFTYLPSNAFNILTSEISEVWIKNLEFRLVLGVLGWENSLVVEFLLFFIYNCKKAIN